MKTVYIVAAIICLAGAILTFLRLPKKKLQGDGVIDNYSK